MVTSNPCLATSLEKVKCTIEIDEGRYNDIVIENQIITLSCTQITLKMNDEMHRFSTQRVIGFLNTVVVIVDSPIRPVIESEISLMVQDRKIEQQQMLYLVMKDNIVLKCFYQMCKPFGITIANPKFTFPLTNQHEIVNDVPTSNIVADSEPVIPAKRESELPVSKPENQVTIKNSVTPHIDNHPDTESKSPFKPLPAPVSFRGSPVESKKIKLSHNANFDKTMEDMTLADVFG